MVGSKHMFLGLVQLKQVCQLLQRRRHFRMKAAARQIFHQPRSSAHIMHNVVAHKVNVNLR